MRESSRMSAVQSPMIPIVNDLIRAHPGTISLGQGVVYYGPPREAADALKTFLADPENHKYKPVQGIPPLIDALESKLWVQNQIRTQPASRIVVTAGGNMAFMNALFAITDPGDEVILLAPYYFNHEMAITIADCRPVIVDTDENYQPRLDALRDAITPRTRAIVTISPNNPTGVVYPEPILRDINALCAAANLYHITDEAYEDFLYDHAAHFSPAAGDRAAEHTISLFSLSKSHGFASWRIGYMHVPEHLFEPIRKIQDTNLICPPVVSQYAALGALRAGPSYPREKLQAIAEVRRIVLDELNRIQQLLTIPRSQGAFYFFPHVHTEMPAMELVERLIREHRIAVMPGATFGAPDCALRIAYGALNKDTAHEGVTRLVRGLKAIFNA